MKLRQKFAIFAAAIGVISLVGAAPASAHVTVRPAEALTGSFQTFTVGAPNEKAVPFVAIKVMVPENLQHVSPALKAGWQVAVQKQGEGESAKVTSITWSGNSVAAGFREDFSFSAQVPAETTDLQWKAYQTYEGGEVVAWDLSADQQPKKADGAPDFSKSGPFSVTKVVATTQSATDLAAAQQAATHAKTTATRALYVAVAGVVVGLVGIAFASRKKA